MTTRDRIRDAGAQMFRRNGYTGTGVKQVAAAAGAQLGPLYHFFPGPHDPLAHAVIPPRPRPPPRGGPIGRPAVTPGPRPGRRPPLTTAASAAPPLQAERASANSSSSTPPPPL